MASAGPRGQSINATPIAAIHSERGLIEGVVAHSRLFSGISAQQNQEIARQSWTTAAQRGDVLATRHARLPGIFLVAMGMAKLSICTENGEEHVTRVVGAGESFGEPYALLEQACPYEARAITDTKLIVIPSALILTFIDRDSRFARHIVKSLSEQCTALLAKAETTGSRRSDHRLASYIAALMGPSGRVDACTIRLPLSKTVIASLLDMTKETLSRGLHSLAEQGLIRVRKSEVTVLDRARLENLFH